MLVQTIAILAAGWGSETDAKPLADASHVSLAVVARTTDGNPQPYRIDLATLQATASPGLPKVAQGACLSPDGKRYAYIERRTDDGDLVIADARSGEILIRHATGPVGQNPSWSPDGKNIAYSAVAEGNYEVFVFDLANRQAANISKHPSFDADPAWSPDGKQLAFASDRTGAFRLWVMNPDGGDQRSVGDHDFAGWLYPNWSPDGRRIVLGGVVSDKVELFVTHVATGSFVQITNGEGCNLHGRWSPDGRWIACVRFPGKSEKINDSKGALVVYDVISNTFTTVESLAFSSTNCVPSWSMDATVPSR